MSSGQLNNLAYSPSALALSTGPQHWHGIEWHFGQPSR
jgi:hypothetical protein